MASAARTGEPREPTRARRPARVRMSAAERREQLIDVARSLFADRGFEGTSVEEIAARAQVSKPGQILETIAAAKHKRALQSFKEAHPADWVEVLLGCLNSMSAKLCGEAASLLIQEGQLNLLSSSNK